MRLQTTGLAQPLPLTGYRQSVNMHQGRTGPQAASVAPNITRLYFAGKQRKIMSMNAERFFRHHPHDNIRTLPNKNLESIKALAEVILKESPDVIALQEVGDQQLLEMFNRKFLRRQYPNIVSLPTGKNNDIRVAVMCKADVKITEAVSHWREQCDGDPDCGKRDFLETTLKTDTGYEFTLFNAHFKSMSGKRGPDGIPVSDEAGTAPIRLKEATSAARIMNRKFQKNPNARVAVTGDINSFWNTPSGQQVLNTLAMRTDADPDNDLTEVMLKDGKADPTYHGGSRFGKLKLDYTFLSKAMLKDWKSSYVAGRFHRPWKTASDHLPLVTIIEEPDPPGSSKVQKKLLDVLSKKAHGPVKPMDQRRRWSA